MYLEVSNITKIIDKSTILDSVSLSMDKGKIYGLKGKNGSGKTMIMRAICGLIKLTEGEIYIDGKPLDRNQAFPPSIGVLIENPGFINNYSGTRNLKVLADIKGLIGMEEIEQTMALVGLDPHEKKKVKKYSLGMKQKLGIAAAIMENPDMILLDEPTNALDQESIRNLRDILKEYKKRGKLIILSSHDSEELENLSDEIYIIEDGRIKETYIP
jgi:ABC-2 type transport system ATP-binding protein